MIRFDQVSFAYGARKVLQDVSFSINAGERIAILGGSGEGKTTVLKLVLGLLRPESGRILIDGEEITGKTEDDLRAIRMNFSIVFQEGGSLRFPQCEGERGFLPEGISADVRGRDRAESEGAAQNRRPRT